MSGRDYILQETIKGLELAECYYREVARPVIARECPEALQVLAAGLVGEGSECLGFDDAYSRDHDFGPGFCLWLTGADFEKYGRTLARIYDSLPKEFLGFPARKVTRQGADRIGIIETGNFYSRYIGNEQPPQSLMRWMMLPEDMLSKVTNGKVFEDNLGEFTRLRTSLARYPEDIRIKKIAARAAKIGQSGQYNYYRLMKRGDGVGVSLSVDEFLRAVMSMMYLLDGRYCPYYKWMYQGLVAYGIMPETTKKLDLLVSKTAGVDVSAHANKEKGDIIESICEDLLREIKAQGLTWGNESFLETHAERIMSCIEDEAIRGLHVMVG